jgi:arginine deiminase
MDAEQLGRLGKDVLDNQAFQTAFENIKSKLIRAWLDAKADQPEVKDSAWAGIRLLENLKWELEYFMDGANIEKLNRLEDEEAEKELADMKKRKREYLETPLPGTRLVKKAE